MAVKGKSATKPKVTEAPVEVQAEPLIDLGGDIPSFIDVRESKGFEPFEGLRTGSIGMDWVFGNGLGLPRGHITMITGAPGSGKTTISLIIGSHVIRTGGKVAFINAERRFNAQQAYSGGWGMPGKNYRLFEPYCQEDTLNLMRWLANNDFDYVVLDSVAALSPRVEIERDTKANEEEKEDNKIAPVGLFQRNMAQFLRTGYPDIARSKCAFLFLNQQRAKIGGAAWGPQTDPYGGNALKYMVSIMANTEYPTGENFIFSNKDDKTAPVAINVHCRTTAKNSVGPPMRKFQIQVRFEPFIMNPYEEITRFGKDMQLFTSKTGAKIAAGAVWHYKGEPIGANSNKVWEWLAQHPDDHTEIDHLIRKNLQVYRG